MSAFEDGWRSADGRLTAWDELEDEHLENIWMMLERRLNDVKMKGRLDVSWPKERAAEAMKCVETERERRRAAGIIVPRRQTHDADREFDVGEIGDYS